MEAFEAWRTKYQGVRETLNTALITSGEDPVLVAEAEELGQQHGKDWIAGASDRKSACELWVWQMANDAFNPETFISFPLRKVREYLQPSTRQKVGPP
jgi:hypothetical protein